MDKIKLLRWVQKGMPVDVDGKIMFLHHAAVMDPSEEYCLVCDKNPYLDDYDGTEVMISSIKVKSINPIL